MQTPDAPPAGTPNGISAGISGKTCSPTSNYPFSDRAYKVVRLSAEKKKRE
jgi:hypothetical protein